MAEQVAAPLNASRLIRYLPRGEPEYGASMSPHNTLTREQELVEDGAP
jgi:hypothetical protein